MDLKMNSEDITTAGVVWDCQVKDGIVPIISGEDESLQNAILASFLIAGTIPQLPDAGVPWTKYLEQKLTFAEIDYYIRDSLYKCEKSNYYPEYSIVDNKLVMTIGKMKNGDNYEL